MTRDHIIQAAGLNGPDDGMGSWLSQAIKGSGPLAPVVGIVRSIVPGAASAPPVYGPPTPPAPAASTSYMPWIVVGLGLALVFVLAKR